MEKTTAYPTTDAEVKSYIKEINKETDCNKLVSLSDDIWQHFSCKPDKEEYPYPKTGDILDENRSVKWNREEVERQRQAYLDRADELNRRKNAICNAFDDRIVTLLAKEYRFSKEESRKIWNYAYGQEHSGGTYAAASAYIDFAYVYAELLEIRESK